jgi:hypothetical protein
MAEEPLDSHYFKHYTRLLNQQLTARRGSDGGSTSASASATEKEDHSVPAAMHPLFGSPSRAKTHMRTSAEYTTHSHHPPPNHSHSLTYEQREVNSAIAELQTSNMQVMRGVHNSDA